MLVAAANSFGPPPATLETHITWLDSRLTDPEWRIPLVLLEDEQPIGSARWDELDFGFGAELSIIIAPEARGRGLGTKFITLLVDSFHQSEPQVRWFSARVKEENIPSRQAFLNAGFSVEEIADGVVTLHRALNRP